MTFEQFCVSTFVATVFYFGFKFVHLLFSIYFKLKEKTQEQDTIIINEGGNDKVKERVTEHFRHLESKGYDVLFTALQGSQNYGLDEYTEEYMSDVDTKSVVLPSFEDICKKKTPASTVEIMPNSEEHAEVKDIRLMTDMWKKANISYIELLYSDYVVINPKYKDAVTELLESRDLVAAFNKVQFLKCIKGMAMEKQKALCHPYPTLMDKIEKYGYDGKQLSHAKRLLFFLQDMEADFNLKTCFRVHNGNMSKSILQNHKKQLVSNGTRVMSQEEAVMEMDETIERVNYLVESLIQNTPNSINTEALDFLDNFVYNVLKKKFKEEITLE